MGTLALEMAHNIGNVVFHNGDERRIVEVAVGNPARNLSIPYKCVAAHKLPVLLSSLNNFVGISVGEYPTGTLESVKLHFVLARVSTEIFLVSSDGPRWGVVHDTGVY